MPRQHAPSRTAKRACRFDEGTERTEAAIPRMIRAKPAQLMKLMIATIMKNVATALMPDGIIAASASRK